MNLTDSSAGFGIALTDRLLAKPDAGNVFISPLSATLALSMAASAAEGPTRASIMTTLGLDPALGVYTAIVARLRDVVWMGAGLALVWLAGRRAAPQRA